MSRKDPPGLRIDPEYLEVGRKYSVWAEDCCLSVRFTALFVGWVDKDNNLLDEYVEDNVGEQWSNGVLMDTWIAHYIEVEDEERSVIDPFT